MGWCGKCVEVCLGCGKCVGVGECKGGGGARKCGEKCRKVCLGVGEVC